jgi:hypothetical protein
LRGWGGGRRPNKSLESSKKTKACKSLGAGKPNRKRKRKGKGEKEKRNKKSMREIGKKKKATEQKNRTAK